MSQATYDAVICIHGMQMSNLDVLQDPYPAVEFHRLLLQFSLWVQRSCIQSMKRLWAESSDDKLHSMLTVFLTNFFASMRKKAVVGMKEDGAL